MTFPQLVLHIRIRNCKITKDKFKIPKDFKLSDHIDVQMGVWGNSGGAKVLNPPELKEMIIQAAKDILSNQ